MMKSLHLLFLVLISWSFHHVKAQENWYPLTISESPVKVEFDMTDWLHQPAWKHGGVLIDGDRKVLKGDWPLEAMAVGKVGITFTTENPTP